jgi:hypothetical protein
MTLVQSTAIAPFLSFCFGKTVNQIARLAFAFIEIPGLLDRKMSEFLDVSGDSCMAASYLFSELQRQGTPTSSPSMIQSTSSEKSIVDLQR